MKKLFILMTIVTISSSAFAQFGITGGASLSSLQLKIDDPDIISKSLTGFTLGIFADVPLSAHFILRPGLNYTQKGGKISFTGGDTEVTRKLNFMELPLNVIYKTTGRFFIGAGPSFAYAMGGKDNHSPDNTDNRKLKIGSNENGDDVKPFEFSGNLLAGYQLSSSIFFSVNYNTGFSNLSPIKGDDESFKTSHFGIKIGKKFGITKK